MKLAIHNGLGWNQRWAEYCTEKNIPFILVDCYSSDIIGILKHNGITHLMWHFSHSLPGDIFLARNVLFSAQKMGVNVFPNFNTSWHFDDKVSQKYILEAIDAPLVPSYVFCDKEKAKKWLSTQSFPIVAKLRRGAGSYNVRLIKSYEEGSIYINRMFGKGIKPTPGYLSDSKNKLKVAGNIQGILNRLKKAPNFFKMIKDGRLFPREKGYVYFQDFIPNNQEDLRIAVVGGRIWGFKRKVRENDFRASGSGMIDYDVSDVPLSTIKKMHDISQSLGTQSIAFDLVKDVNNNYLIVEISYGYVGNAIYNAPGYWNAQYEFIEGHFFPEYLILDDFIK